MLTLIEWRRVMQKIWIVCLILICAEWALADHKAEPDLLALSQQYMQAYGRWDIDAMSAMHAPEIQFNDPTATEAFQANYAKQGKTQVAAFFKGIFPNGQPKHITFKWNEHFISGQHVVIQSTFESLVPAAWFKPESKGQLLVSIPVTTILRFHDGQIITHTDYADYNSYRAQAALQMP